MSLATCRCNGRHQISEGLPSAGDRLPVPRPGQVLGLVGTNGIGKSTALKVLAGKLKPNLGRFEVRVTVLTHLAASLWLSMPGGERHACLRQ